MHRLIGNDIKLFARDGRKSMLLCPVNQVVRRRKAWFSQGRGVPIESILPAKQVAGESSSEKSS